MITDVKAAAAAAGALGAKAARACDSCLRRRARWFCGADDAFLCHGCDTLVHSANQLASRHERVRLQTASSKKETNAHARHTGFTRKARTPRHNKHLVLQQRPKDQVLFKNTSALPVVPELGDEEPQVDDETEDQLLLRVPVFDPFDVEPCNIYNQVNKDAAYEDEEEEEEEEEACDLDNFSAFLPSDMDLAEFAADVESLIGSGFDYKEEEYAKSAMVKVKDEEFDADTGFDLESVLDMTSEEAFHWNIDSLLSPAETAKEEEEKVVVPVVASNNTSVSKEGTKRDIFLRLNYEEVITAWASQGSPWTTGNPPKFNSDDFWSNCLVLISSLDDC